MQVRRRLGLGGSALLIALTGFACSDNDADPPTLDPETPASGSDTDPAAPTGTTSGTDADVGPVPQEGDRVADDSWSVVAGELPAAAGERRLAKVLVSYLEVRVASYHAAASDPRLGGVATGQALSDVQLRSAELAQRGEHTVGDSVLNVSSVEVDGDSATFDACLENAAVDVDESGVAVESPPAAYDVTATAVQAAPGTWLVETIVGEPAETCDGPS